MKSYRITIPAFSLIVIAHSEKEALEQFWFDYDCAQEDPEFGKPIIELMQK